MANVFLERCLEFNTAGGSTQIVMPQNWLFLTSYKKQRQHFLTHETWNLLARLGAGAFGTISGEVVNVILLTVTHQTIKDKHLLLGVDASASRTPEEKAEILLTGPLAEVSQFGQLENPDARISLSKGSQLSLLAEDASGTKGITTNDDPLFVNFFWEQCIFSNIWELFESTVESTVY